MATITSTKIEKYDDIIVGAGLSGLLVAKHLQHSGRKIALIERSDVVGGGLRAAECQYGAFDRVLNVLPATDASEQILLWLESVLQCEIPRRIIDEPALTFADGKFKPFVGFGDSAVKTAGEISAYAVDRYYQCELTCKDWIQVLREAIIAAEVPTFLNSHATHIAVENNQCTDLQINGAKRLALRQLYFCGGPAELVSALPPVSTPARLRSRIVKGDIWTSINLHLVHDGVVSESQAVHVLRGANEEPSVGIFSKPITLPSGKTVQTSQWLTLVGQDMTEDAEIVAAALKQIKRQVKRAYETSLDGLLDERIIVGPASHGDLIGALSEDGQWPKISNLRAISGIFEREKNLLGCLTQVRRVLGSGAVEVSSQADSVFKDSSAELI